MIPSDGISLYGRKRLDIGKAGTSGGLYAAPDGVGMVASLTDGVDGFFNELGYAIDQQGGYYYIVKVLDDLSSIDSYNNGCWKETGTKGAGTFTFNGKTITLPMEASSTKDMPTALLTGQVLTCMRPIISTGCFSAGNIPKRIGLTQQKSRFYGQICGIAGGKVLENKAYLAMYNFTDNSNGAVNKVPIQDTYWVTLSAPVLKTCLTPHSQPCKQFGHNYLFSLAEGLASIGGYYNSNSSGLGNREDGECADNFAIVISSHFLRRLGYRFIRTGFFFRYDGDGTDSVDYSSEANWGDACPGHRVRSAFP
ncbi:MAG: hypothetical protein R2941_00605 [Desulfobacterales bacterium]